MKKILTIFLIIILAIACTKKIYVPIEKTEYVTVHDTTLISTNDTLIQVPEVSIGDFIDITDTLRLSGTLSSASAWVDTTHGVLAGRLIQSGKLPVTIVEKERLVYRDSIITQEIPVPVVEEKIVKVVPWFWRIMSVIGIFAVAFVLFKFFWKK